MSFIERFPHEVHSRVYWKQASVVLEIVSLLMGLWCNLVATEGSCVVYRETSSWHVRYIAEFTGSRH